MNLKNIKTCDLVKELRKREGVETFDVRLEDNCRIEVTAKKQPDPYDKLNEDDGPAIILKIID